MARLELSLLLLICVSSAMIDPPVEEVHDHNIGLASTGLQGIGHSNLLGEGERLPTLDDPTTFFYLRALTLTPSVNMSVTSKEGLHPWLVWIVAEDHVGSLTQRNGRTEYDQEVTVSQYREPMFSWVSEDYGAQGGPPGMAFDEQGTAQEYHGPGTRLVPRVTWLDAEPEVSGEEPEDDERSCDTVITRHYDEMEIEDVSAAYTLSGILKSTDGTYTYETARRELLLADNETFVNPSKVPFEHQPDLLCWLLGTLNSYLLGDMFDIDCYEETLVRASPYATGTYNVTVRNLTVVDPRLNVTLTGTFSIFYEEEGESCSDDGEGGCDCYDWDTNGTITLTDSHDLSYEVQNDYMTVVPYLPKFLSFDANTSEDVEYYFSLMSNSELRKYYSGMDGKVASAYYLHTFDVEEDGAGIRHIIAQLNGSKGLLAEDPYSGSAYPGGHRLLVTEQGIRLRSPTEVTNQSYNYSRAYSFKEVFYNLTPGSHHADMMLYTWWGDYTAASDINVRKDTLLWVSAYRSAEDEVTVDCKLTTTAGSPIAGEAIELRMGDETAYATTGSDGICVAIMPTEQTAGTVEARFRGSGEYMPADDRFTIFASRPLLIDSDSLGFGFAVLLMVALLVGMLFMNIMSTMGMLGGAAPGGMLWGKLLADRRGPGRKMIRVKKGKELAVSVAGALAGGAGGAAAGKIAEKEAAKKMAKKHAEKAAKKQAERRTRKKAEDAAGKAHEMKRKRAMMDKDTAVAGAGKRYREKREVEELLESLRKKREAKAKIRASQEMCSPQIVEAVRKESEEIVERKIRLISKSLKDPASDGGSFTVARDRLRKTRVFVAETHTWRQESTAFGPMVFTAHGMNSVDEKGINEIFIVESRAQDERGRLKTLIHEFDHSVCLYREDILNEGHADWTTIHEMGKKYDKSCVSYSHEMATYEMLADLAGETHTKNHSAYAGGTEELRSKIIENHKGRMSGKEIGKRFDMIVNTDLDHSDEAYRNTKNLYKKLKGENYEIMEKKLDRVVGELL